MASIIARFSVMGTRRWAFDWAATAAGGLSLALWDEVGRLPGSLPGSTLAEAAAASAASSAAASAAARAASASLTASVISCSSKR
jgi:hypothetical protein